MGMKEMMSWNTDRDLSCDEKKMSVVSINGTMMETNSHAQKGFSSLVQSAAFDLSWSPMMNRLFIKMMSARLHGLTSPIRPFQGPKATASQSWCLTSSHQTGAACTTTMSAFPSFFYYLSLFDPYSVP
jgi:hypothetical protein